MSPSENTRGLAFAITMTLIGLAFSLFVSIEVFMEQNAMKASVSEIAWSFRQEVFHQYAKALSRSEKHPENEEASQLISEIRARIHAGDELLEKGDIAHAMPIFRSVGYDTERVENYLTCFQPSCEQ